jgi:hypothetical protein
VSLFRLSQSFFGGLSNGHIGYDNSRLFLFMQDMLCFFSLHPIAPPASIISECDQYGSLVYAGPTGMPISIGPITPLLVHLLGNPHSPMCVREGLGGCAKVYKKAPEVRGGERRGSKKERGGSGLAEVFRCSIPWSRVEILRLFCTRRFCEQARRTSERPMVWLFRRLAFRNRIFFLPNPLEYTNKGIY